jgi:hypothetical protein
METGRSPSYFRLAQLAAAALADFTTARPPEALGGHLTFAVGWKRGTLERTYHSHTERTGRLGINGVGSDVVGVWVGESHSIHPGS